MKSIDSMPSRIVSSLCELTTSFKRVNFGDPKKVEPGDYDLSPMFLRVVRTVVMASVAVSSIMTGREDIAFGVSALSLISAYESLRSTAVKK